MQQQDNNRPKQQNIDLELKALHLICTSAWSLFLIGSRDQDALSSDNNSLRSRFKSVSISRSFTFAVIPLRPAGALHASLAAVACLLTDWTVNEVKRLVKHLSSLFPQSVYVKCSIQRRAAMSRSCARGKTASGSLWATSRCPQVHLDYFGL